jgi:hypothetical protein
VTEPSASPGPAPSAPPGAAGGARASEKRATLPRELADFLIEFSIALHKHAMYPGGHPTLGPAAEGVARRLDSLLLERGTLSLGVAREQLIIEGVATDPRNPVLKDLADRLHRHHLGAISFHRGVSPFELEEALKVVATDADRGADPIGLRQSGNIPSWKHLQLFPLTFDRLELVGGPDEDDGGGSTVTGGRGAQLWVGLARAALASEDVGSGTARKPRAQVKPPEPHAFRANLGPAEPMSDAEIAETLGAAAGPDEVEAGAAEPAAVARAIEQHERGTAYDQVIVGYLLQSAELLKQGGQGSLALKKKMSKLISSLDDNTRSRLLEMSGDKRQRNRFILDASQGMSMDAVVDLVNAAASGNGSPISSSMLRMLQKLSLHAERGSAPRRTMAESAIREQISELVQGWELADPNPDGYSAALQKMSMSAPTLVVAEEAAFAPEAERMVKMSIETGGVGDPLERAIGDIVASGKILNLVAMLDGAPRQNDATKRIRDRVEDPSMMRAALAAQPVDFDLVDQLISANRDRATGPMLDVLTESESRTLRRALIDRLIRMPDLVRPHLASRVNDERWYVTRNILFIAAELPGTPLAVDATPFRQHPDWRVRREALRVLFRHAEERTRAICTALSDEDPRLKQLALNAVVEGGCPEPAVPILVSIASDEENDSELRVGAIKALGTKGGTLPLEALLKLTEIKRRSIIDVVSGSSASAEFLAAITALGALRAETRARERLDLIARGRDPGAARAAADALRGA